jgi:hypothetical protein
MKAGRKFMDLHLPKFVRAVFSTSGCPAQQELAAYADHQWIGPRRHWIERHLVSCDTCVQQVAFLVRTAQQGEPVPSDLMNKAFALAKQEVRHAYPIWKLALPGAFVLLLLSIVSWRLIEHKGAPTHFATETPAPTQTAVVAHNVTPAPRSQEVFRGNDSVESPFLFPTPNQRVDASKLVFRWKPVRRANLYDIEVVTDDGSVIWAERVKASSAVLPSDIHLVKEASYFVRLRIHMVYGSVEVTKAVAFIAE